MVQFDTQTKIQVPALPAVFLQKPNIPKSPKLLLMEACKSIVKL